MQTERIFNTFLYFDAGVATEYGVRHHIIGGSDQKKLAYLLSQIERDHLIARRFRFTRGFTSRKWLAELRLGYQLKYFEEAFSLYRATARPVFCITSVVDGTPVVDKQIGPEPYRGGSVTAIEHWGATPDYLERYISGKVFRFTELIHDDYFKAIRTLFTAKLYVSCSKLLMSCIYTLAFVEYGDVSGNFSKWIDAYVDLRPCNILVVELWEFRNSILHMTNLASRKVLAGKTSPIMPYVGEPRSLPSIAPHLPKPFNLSGLIEAIGGGIGKWGETYNTDSEKLLKFIERCDTTVSDSRVALISAHEIE